MMERARRKAAFGPGKVLPDIACTDLQGHVFKLSDLRGKVVVVDFFARGFTLYPRTLKQLASAYQQFQKDGLEIVSINMEQAAKPEELAAFAQTHGMSWGLVPSNAELTHKLAIFGDPALFLVGRNGAIVARDMHESNILQSIKDALGVR